LALLDETIPTINPKSPRADPKISIIKIFTKSAGFAASAKAQPAPVIPTAILMNSNQPGNREIPTK
jgi:hypothetical protein